MKQTILSVLIFSCSLPLWAQSKAVCDWTQFTIEQIARSQATAVPLPLEISENELVQEILKYSSKDDFGKIPVR